MAEKMCKSKAFGSQYRKDERQPWKATEVKELIKKKMPIKKQTVYAV